MNPKRPPEGYVDVAADMMSEADVELYPQPDWVRLADLLSPLETGKELPEDARQAILKEARAAAGANPVALRLVEQYEVTR